MSDPNCIFCKIIAGEIPSYKVYEDESVFAFLSIGAINAGHTLVIPKNHVETFIEMSEKENADVFNITQIIGKRINQKLKPKKVGIIVAGWDIPHTHIHVIPMNKYHDITSEKILKKELPKFSQEDFEKILKKLIIDKI